MSVDKYDVDKTGLAQVSETGNWVKATDYHALEKLVEELSKELSRSQRLLWEPVNENFMHGVMREAGHQVERWGTEQDHGKEPQDWYWLIGYLAGKALRASIEGNTEKALHHCISTAAVCANWHAHINGTETLFRPGLAQEKTTNVG